MKSPPADHFASSKIGIESTPGFSSPGDSSMGIERRHARELAERYAARGDALGWFEPLYAEAYTGSGEKIERIPWAETRPNPNLVSWYEWHCSASLQGTALVVGCGLGDDAEYLASQGFQVSAFDISRTAIAWCRSRFPLSNVAYEACDLFQAPESWKLAFDFVFEAYTLQVLPAALRSEAMRRIADWVSPGGTLLVVARARESHEPAGEMPWPLTRNEMATFTEAGLVVRQFEDYLDAEEPPVRRFRVCYQRGSQHSK
jgi:SAM-dependent methyltransferase